LPIYARPGLCLLLLLGLTLSAHAEGIRFSRITVSGNRAIASTSIDKVTAEYLNRALGDEDLQRLRQALDALYAAQGFRSSRARLPDQRLDTGVLRIEMIEASRSWDTQLKLLNDARDMDAATADLMSLSQEACQKG
jgi:hypothetical protein